MTTYRLFPSTNGPSTGISYSGNFIAGVAFAVKGGGNWFNGYYMWVPSSTNSTAPVKCCLWSPTQATTGSVVSGSVVTSGTLTAGQWNYIPLPTPIQLAASLDSNLPLNGSAYIAAIGVNGNFPDTLSQFNSVSDVYANGITNGPLFAFSGGWQTSTKPPYSIQGQGLFSVANSDPTLAMPNQADSSGDGGSNFWVDVQISDTPPAGYQGSYRLWPNKADANPLVSGDAAYNYTIATEIKLTAPCTLNNIWYYSIASATTLATRCDVWDVNTGLSVASITSPSWKDATGASFTAGTHQSGSLGTWIQAAFAGGVTLPAGDYRVSVYNSNGSTDANWSPKDATSDYWGQTLHGVGYQGITNGPLSAPSWSNASSGYAYGGSGSDTPPWSSGGTTVAHAQSVFYEGSAGQTGVVGFPQLYAAVGVSSNQSQNYWVDLEVTPLPPVTDLPEILPGPTWLKVFKPWMNNPYPVNLGFPGPITVAPGITGSVNVQAITGTLTEVIAGIVSTNTVAALAGTVTETLTGLVSGVAVAASTGTVTEAIAGITSNVNVAAPLGTVTSGMTLTVATVSVTAQADVTTVTVNGITGLVNVAAPLGSVAGTAGPLGTVAIAAPTGSIQATFNGLTVNDTVSAITGSMTVTVNGLTANVTSASSGIVVVTANESVINIAISALTGFASYPVTIQGITAQVNVLPPLGTVIVPATYIVANWKARLIRSGVRGGLFD